MTLGQVVKTATFCQGCGRTRQQGEWGCPDCGCDIYGRTVPGTARPRAGEPTPLKGVLADLVALPPGAIALVHGPRGIGKTSILLQAMPTAWVVTAEMEPRQVQRYARRLKVKISGISVPEWYEDPPELPELRLNIPTLETPPDVIFDSLTATGRPAEALTAVRAWCRAWGVRGMVIAQQTKEGEVRGPSTLGFDVDVEIRLDQEGGNRRIVVEKNRFGPEGSKSYRLTETGPALPEFDRYYSVEGANGRYRLEPYPSAKSTPHAAYLREAEKTRSQDGDDLLRLPAPPAAVSALPSRLYRGGWIEPPDWKDRENFAKNHGIPYYSPCSPSPSE